MTFVLDASSALRLVLDDEDEHGRHEVEDRFRTDGSATVPSLFLQEVTNALVRAARRGRVSETKARDHLTRLTRLPITVPNRSPSPSALMELSLRHGLTAYDATYLELALTLGVALLTGDKALGRAAQQEGLT